MSQSNPLGAPTGQRPPSSPSALQIALEFNVIRRAVIMALIVGTVLVFINHCNCCLINGTFGLGCAVKSILTFFVPYAVSTISSVLAIKGQAKSGR